MVNLLDKVPNGWNNFYENASYPELGNMAKYLMTSANKNKDNEYIRLFPLAEKCYEQAKNKSSLPIFTEKLADLNFQWSVKLQDHQELEKAFTKAQLAYELVPNTKNIIQLYGLSSQEAQKNLFEQLIHLPYRRDLELAGDFYYKKERYVKAQQLYKKRIKLGQSQQESMLAILPILVKLDKIANKQETSQNIASFFQNESLKNLKVYMRYFLPEAKDRVKFKENLEKYEIINLLINQALKLTNNPLDKKEFARLVNNYAYFQLHTGDFVGAEVSTRKGLEIDSTIASLRLKIPLALLFQDDKFEAAKEEFKKWATKSYQVANSPYSIYAEKFLKDLESIENQEVIPLKYQANMQEIKDYLEAIVKQTN